MKDRLQARQVPDAPRGAHVALDAGRAIRMSGGDVSFAQELLELYLSGLPRRLSKLHHGYESGDLEQVARAAHSLSSASQTLGVMAIGKLAALIEDRAWAGDLAAAREPLQDLLKAVDAFKDVVLDFDWATLAP